MPAPSKLRSLFSLQHAAHFSAVLLLLATLFVLISATPAHAQTPVSLPAPFYFIDGYSNQVVRLAADGVTRRTVTRETSPVTALAVAPYGGKLAYVAGNRLIETDASGLNRVVKLEGGPAVSAGEAGSTNQISAPVYSPDGARIAFARGGINLIASGPDANGEDAVTLVLPDDPYPTDGAVSAEPVRFFRPNSWSPDGVHLLVDFSYFPEGGGMAILAPDANILVEVTPDPEAEDPGAIPLFGDVAWKLDSTGFFIGSGMVYYGAPGLALVDAGTGIATGILTTPSSLAVTEETPLLAVRGPHWTATGALRAYVSEQAAMDVPAPYQLAEIDPASGQRTPLNEQDYPALEATTWADDDSGALLLTDVQYTDLGTNGTIQWAPIGGDALTWLAYGRAAQWGTEQYGSTPAEAQAVVALFDQAIDLAGAQAGQDPVPFGPSEAFPVFVGDTTYWVVHTTGTRSFTPDKPHALGIYRQDGDQWQEVSLIDLTGSQEGVTAGPDYLSEGAVTPVEIGPAGATTSSDTQLWLQVEGGAGAHSGVCQIVRLAGDELRQELDGFSSSPGACTVEDVDGDGANEVVLDATDYYVFCYACGVRFVDYAVERWEGQAFAQVTLQPLPAAAPDALVARNDELLRLAQGGLWKAALDLANAPAATMAAADAAASSTVTVTEAIRGESSLAAEASTSPVTGTLAISPSVAVTLSDPSGVYNWNVALVRLVGEARRAEAEAAEQPYPLLAQVFYGDYPAAVDVMRVYTVTEVFAQPSLLISGTVAAGWESALAGWLTTTASSAIEVNPQLAAAYFVRGFGTWLGGTAAATASDLPPDALPVTDVPMAPDTLAAAAEDIRQALALSPDIEQGAYYAAALTLLTGEEVAPPAAGGTGSSGVSATGIMTTAATSVLTSTTGVTATATATGTAVTSPTANTGGQGRLLYSTVQDGIDRIDLLTFGTANATVSEVIDQARQGALQPGGVRLAYQSTRQDMLGLGGYDLTAARGTDGQPADPNAAGRFNFTANLEDSLPRWHPAGDRLVFSSTRYGDGRSRIYTMWAEDLAYATAEPVDQGEGSDADWSPDGTRIVYKGCDETGANCGLWTMAPSEAGGTDRRQLTDNAGDSRPRWAPDGSRIVFMSDGRDGNWDVYSVVVNPDFSGGEVTRITFNAASDGLPAVSPDGREIVFVSNRGNQWGIWRVAIESGRAQSVVGDLGALTNWLDQGLDWVP
jgi:Tol biopolymer transport system component